MDPVVDFASLPTSHPIREYCRTWDVQNPKAQDALVDLVKDAILHTVAKVTEHFTGPLEES